MKLHWEGLLPISGKVIVVEERPTLRTLMAYVLKEMGTQSLVFETADYALTYVLQAHTNCPLVIMHDDLPGKIQGAEFIRMVKGKWPSAGSILISDTRIQPATIPAGTKILQKNCSLDEFVVAVATVLQPGYPLRKS